MLHSTYYHKDTNEDPKTSSVFENLLLLPDNILWQVIRNACHDHSELPQSIGMLNNYEFWPHWDAKNTNNANFVEPDLFLEFDNLDVIIEAKYSDYQGQYRDQWKNEIVSYINEYGNEKNVVLIAVGGNDSMDCDSIKTKNTTVNIIKCSWASLLIEVCRFKEQLANISFVDMGMSATKRLLDNIILAFNLNGVYNIKWFDTLLDMPHISSESYITLHENFKYE